MEPGRGTTVIGDAASTDAVVGATVAASMDAATMGGEETTAVDAAITAEATVADTPAVRTVAVTQGVVSVEVSTVVAVDSTVAVPMAADADNRCSDLAVSEMNPAGCQRGQLLFVATLFCACVVSANSAAFLRVFCTSGLFLP